MRGHEPGGKNHSTVRDRPKVKNAQGVPSGITGSANGDGCLGTVKDRPASLSEWLPIKTAPKDGDAILIGWFTPSGHGLLSSEWNIRCAWWDKTEKGWTDNAVNSWGYEEVQIYKPSHWMNVPAPPAT